MSERTKQATKGHGRDRSRRTLAAAAVLLGLVRGPDPSAKADEPDPTRPPDASARVAMAVDEGPEDFDLRAILFASGRRIAIVNGQRVAEGDTIAGARVERIDARRVRLVRAAETIDLALGPPDVKRPHGAANGSEVDLRPPAALANGKGGMTGPIADSASQEEAPR